MAKKSGRPRELELLAEKVREAKELVGRLRESNRSLTTELAELKSRLQGVESPARSAHPAHNEKTSPPSRQAASGHSAQLDLLRRERKEIREKISHLLEKLEGDSGSGSAG